MAGQKRRLAKVYVVLLVDHPELGVQAAFTTASRAREFAARYDLRAYVDEADLHRPDCCLPSPALTVTTQP